MARLYYRGNSYDTDKMSLNFCKSSGSQSELTYRGFRQTVIVGHMGAHKVRESGSQIYRGYRIG